MDLVSRLKTYIEHVNLPFSQFADIAQIPRPTLSQILNGRNKKISNELLEKLHSAFPNLNISWLLFGDGVMDIDPNLAVEPPFPNKEISNEEEAGSSSNAMDANQSHENQSYFPELPGLNPLANTQSQKNVKENHNDPISSITKEMNSSNLDQAKKIQTIIVFYSDNSFEIFDPAR